jgi:hypothetical protein
MTRKDLAALRECLALAERDPMVAEQLRDMARDGRSRIDRALFACAILQDRNLDLKPWQVPPVDAVDDELDPAIRWAAGYIAEWQRAHAVVERLLALDLSPYVADPLAAIRRAEGSYGEPPAAA